MIIGLRCSLPLLRCGYASARAIVLPCLRSASADVISTYLEDAPSMPYIDAAAGSQVDPG